ncbi:hypothetical protein ACFQU1_07300 [Chelatococcus sp. GCM10030263]|uniref:hypothetical protein n=1 Tax=Chelatococcus sp. GCM10030263 TaxID=3273387 RepID=UPI00360D53B9
MRWTGYYLINLDADDDRTRETADQWREKYAIDRERFFAPQGQLWPPAQASGAHKLYSPLIRHRSLAPLDRQAKLIIVGCGQRTLTVPWATTALARELHGWGMREVGLIVMQTTFTKPIRYVHDLAMALNERSIGFGWLAVYQICRRCRCARRDPAQIVGRPAAALRGNIMTPEADKWYFPKYR